MITAISFIIVFSLLVMFHEFGHFIVAKLNGILVHEFAIGMGPVIFKKQGRETLYSLRALPIGGYVKMEGEDEASEDPKSFSSKSPWRRLSVIVAGPFMNFVLAFLIFLMMFLYMGVPSNEVADLIVDYPAYESGLQAGDEIVEINGQPIKSWNDIVENIQNSEGHVSVVVNRDGGLVSYEIEPIMEDGVNYMIGIVPAYKSSLIGSTQYAMEQVRYLTVGIFDFFGDLITGQGSQQGEVVGPVGIVSLVGQAAKTSFLSVAGLAAYISINLGIINLLPLPALDGGRIMFILYEIVRGKPVDRDKEGFVHFIGFVILMAFMVYMIFKDIMRLDFFGM